MPSNTATRGLLYISLLSNAATISFAASGGSAGGSAGKRGGSESEGGDLSSDNIVIIIIVIIIGVMATIAPIFGCLVRKSIIMVQVALTGEAQLLLRDINQIARTTSTQSMWGCRRIFVECSRALLRNSQYFISAYSRVERKWTKEIVMDRFKYFSKQEHEKFDMESLVNFNNTVTHQIIPIADQLPTDYIVVTFLMATNRAHKIPQVRCIKTMEEPLKRLTEIETHQLLAVEVLWTPQNEKDNLTKPEFLAKYPCLMP